MHAHSSPGVTGLAQHPRVELAIRRVPRSITVRSGGHQIAYSSAALELLEPRRAAVLYLPAADIDGEYLSVSTHSTVCPFKGQASYWDLVTPAGVIRNAAWSYPSPYAELAELAGYIAFYPDKVDVALSD